MSLIKSDMCVSLVFYTIVPLSEITFWLGKAISVGMLDSTFAVLGVSRHALVPLFIFEGVFGNSIDELGIDIMITGSQKALARSRRRSIARTCAAEGVCRGKSTRRSEQPAAR